MRHFPASLALLVVMSMAAWVGPAAAQSSVDVDGEAAALRASFRQEVPHSLSFNPVAEAARIELAQREVIARGEVIDHAMMMLVVDRNPHVDQMSLVLARPDAPWEVMGSVKVSTGQPGRKGYYITPTGVFLNTAGILGYRALGTFNENHIRGIGLKGSRVWDFGWQNAVKGWLHDGQTGDIRLEMHATDPVLEARFGRPASEGCVRISAPMNKFLDNHGVIDAELEEAARTDGRFAALLPRDRTPTPLAGHALVVVDSGDGV